MGLFRNKKKKPGFFERHPSLVELCRPYYIRLHNYLRIPGRARLANRWARKHPKRLASIYAALSVFLLSMCFITSMHNLKSAKKEDTLDMQRISNLNKTFENLHEKEVNDNLIRDQLSKLGNQGLQLANELDSLLKLDVKNKSDSLRINALYNILTSSFYNDKNHENRSEEN